MIDLPRGPGLGLAVDWAKVKRYEVGADGGGQAGGSS